MASFTDRAKSFVKRVIGRPEEPTPVVTVKDFVSDIAPDPKRGVRRLLLPQCALYVLTFDMLHLGPTLRGVSLPDLRLDHPIQ